MAMEVSWRKGIMVAVMITTMMIVMVGYSECVLHKVGDKGWILNYNYSIWLSQQRFYVDDWLLFTFDKRYYNVLEVNKTSYENCNDKGFIRNITKGGRDVVQLTEARPYYFLSGGGYCWHGMKLAIVVEVSPPAPVPQPSQNGSPFINHPPGFHVLVSSVVVWFGALLWF